MLGKLWGKRCAHSVDKVRDVARPSSNHTSNPSAFYAGDYNLITFLLHKTRWDRSQALIFTLAAEAGSGDSSLMFKDAPSSSTWNVERGVGNERKSYAHAPRILYFSSAPVSRRLPCGKTGLMFNNTANVERGDEKRRSQTMVMQQVPQLLLKLKPHRETRLCTTNVEAGGS